FRGAHRLFRARREVGRRAAGRGNPPRNDSRQGPVRPRSRLSPPALPATVKVGPAARRSAGCGAGVGGEAAKGGSGAAGDRTAGRGVSDVASTLLTVHRIAWGTLL